jgi:hypothetical protein
VNFVVARGLVAVFADRRGVVRTVRQELVPALPSVALVVLIATGSLDLTQLIGPAGLLPLAFAVAAPQLTPLMLTALTPPASSLSTVRARVRYATALADLLGLPRRERAVIRHAARGGWGISPLTGDPGDLWFRIGLARFYQQERYDGRGQLGVARGFIPIESRILAVADGWAQLTAQGTPELPHYRALLMLEQRAEVFDPVVLAAARELVAAEDAVAEASNRAPATLGPMRRLLQLASE